MARERGAVAGIVGGVVYRFDMRESGEIHQARAEDRRADGGAQTLAQGGGAAGGRRVLLMIDMARPFEGFRVTRAHANPRARHAGFKQRPPTAGLLDDFFGPVSGLARGLLN